MKAYMVFLIPEEAAAIEAARPSVEAARNYRRASPAASVAWGADERTCRLDTCTLDHNKDSGT